MTPNGAATLLMVCLAATLTAGLALVVVSTVAVQQIRQSMTNERTAQANVVARAVRADLDRAIGYGISLEEMRGVGDYLATRVAQQSELHFLAVIGPRNQRSHHVGIDDKRLDEVLQQMPTMIDGVDLPKSLRVGNYVVVREPLRDGSGSVLAAVRPDEITEALSKDIWRKWPFWAGCLLLAISWAATTARAAIVEPIGRLAAAMAAAVAQGRFFTLLIRRDRDAVGACLFSFNAVVAGLHAHRHDFSAQAEAVRNAVFDPAVAEQVEQLRAQTQRNLGEGLASLPERHFDPRASDADFFAISLAAAGAMSLTTTLAISTVWTAIIVLIAFGAASGVLAGLRFGNNRWSTVPVALILILIAVVAMTDQSLLIGLSPFMAFASGWAIGLSGGVALAQRRVAAADDGVIGGGWTVFLGGLAGLALASQVVGDALTTGVCLAPLALAAAIAAAVPRQR